MKINKVKNYLHFFNNLNVIGAQCFKVQAIQNVKCALSEGCANTVCEHP